MPKKTQKQILFYENEFYMLSNFAAFTVKMFNIFKSFSSNPKS